MSDKNKINDVYEEAAKSLSSTLQRKITAPQARAALMDKMDGRPDKFYIVYDDMADYYKPRYGDGCWETFDAAVAAFDSAPIHDELINWEFENSYENE